MGETIATGPCIDEDRDCAEVEDRQQQRVEPGRHRNEDENAISLPHSTLMEIGRDPRHIIAQRLVRYLPFPFNDSPLRAESIGVAMEYLDDVSVHIDLAKRR
jgi:hypothetical protein